MPVHPTAIVHDGAEVPEDVEVGPYSIIGPRVRLGTGCRIDSQVLLEGRTTLGDDCRVFHGAVVGSIPQDLKFKGEDTRLVIGKGVVIREFATVNLGTSATGETVIGDNCFLMAYSHVAHDCRLGDNVILANAGTLAGHVTLDDSVTIGGLTPVHQFCRIGRHAYIGGGSRVTMDVIPFALAAGNPLRMAGLNLVGLKRQGFEPQVIETLKKAYKFIFRSNLILKDALKRIQQELPGTAEIVELTEFVSNSERGFHR